LKRIGILGTRAVAETGVFGHLKGIDIVAAPDPDAVHRAYVDMAMTGACSAATRALLFSAGRQMMQDGAEAILLGGTDLGLALDGQDPGFGVIDAVAVHVEALAEALAGTPPKSFAD
jgi:aspartate racemase